MILLRTLSTLGRPLLAHLDPELAHTLTIKMLSRFHDATPQPDDPRLSVQALGLDFPNPIGLAAGFDKNAAATEAMLAFGFGFVEAGTVTPRPQEGNPKPRIFRLREDRAVINRLGFNNDGLQAARERLTRVHGRPGVRGINIGANKDAHDRVADYVAGLKELGPHASYVTINISSPNTPGLRGLQELDSLRPLLEAVRETAGETPLLVKIAPDMDDEQIDGIVALSLELGLDGIIATNTTVSREGLRTPAAEVEAMGAGGLSGAPLAERSLEVLRRVRASAPADFCVISVGGVRSAADVLGRLEAGATLVQGFTAFIYEGPLWARAINRGLVAAGYRGNAA